ncbi:MAG: hypothetical protein MRY76_04325, partial [Pseudomonadales bacterium]|nr:hypothetical protein [Pseudomonadales bacterium]
MKLEQFYKCAVRIAQKMVESAVVHRRESCCRILLYRGVGVRYYQHQAPETVKRRLLAICFCQDNYGAIDCPVGGQQVLEHRLEFEGFSNLGQNQAGSSNAAPSRVFMPITSVRSRFGETTTRQTAGGVESETVELHEAIIQVDNQDTVIEIGEVIEQILAR